MAAAPFSGFTLALLAFLSTLPSGADADSVTTRQCEWRTTARSSRVRTYPKDYDATHLWMDSCELAEVNPSSDFEGLPGVTYIFFNDNDIVRVNTTAFRAVPRLFFLILGNNKLRELPVFEENSCNRLTELNVFGNLLTDIKPKSLTACAKLESLVLPRNNIQYIHPDAFSTLSELRTLYLNGNKLMFIPDGLFASNGKLKVLHINQNRLTYLPTDVVASLNHAGAIVATEFFFHDNPIHCGCLLELLAELRGAYVTYYQQPSWIDEYDDVDIAPYDGSRPLCVFVGRYPCYRQALSGLKQSPAR